MSLEEAEALLGPSGDYRTEGRYTVFEHGVLFRRWWYYDDGYILIVIGPYSADLNAAWTVGSKEFVPAPPTQRESCGEWFLRLIVP